MTAVDRNAQIQFSEIAMKEFLFLAELAVGTNGMMDVHAVATVEYNQPTADVGLQMALHVVDAPCEKCNVERPSPPPRCKDKVRVRCGLRCSLRPSEPPLSLWMVRHKPLHKVLPCAVCSGSSPKAIRQIAGFPAQ